jgi:hypothetical protein
MGTMDKTFITAISMATGVLKSGSAILKSKSPQETVPVTAPKTAAVLSRC